SQRFASLDMGLGRLKTLSASILLHCSGCAIERARSPRARRFHKLSFERFESIHDFREAIRDETKQDREDLGAWTTRTLATSQRDQRTHRNYTSSESSSREATSPAPSAARRRRWIKVSSQRRARRNL